MAEAVKNLPSELGERGACEQVGYSRATFRRHHVLERCAQEPLDAQDASERSWRQQRRYQARQDARTQVREQRARQRSSLALAAQEHQAVLDAIHDSRFVDGSVPYIHAMLLDEGVYHCSMSTMYRLLHSVGRWESDAIRRRARPT